MMRKKLLPLLSVPLIISGCGNSIQSAAPNTQSPVTAATTSDVPAPTSAETATAAATTTTTTTIVTTTMTTTTPMTTLVTTSAPPENDSYEFINNCIVAYEGMPQVRAMEGYYFNDDTGEYLASCVDDFAAKAGKKTDVYLMMIPSAQEFYTPPNLAGEYESQLKCTKKVYKKLKKSKGVFINQFLEDHKAEYLYSRSDYHWQPIAAFYAARIFAEQAGVPFADFDTYESVERENYLGAFYSVNNIWQLAEYPDTFTYYKPENLDRCTCTMYDPYFYSGSKAEMFHDDYPVNSSYQMFVGTDETIFLTETDVDNDRVLVIFKDSYGNALLPFLTSSFSKIYLCDNRFFYLNSIDFVKKVGATDVLFAMGAISTTDPSKVSLIEQNMYQ